MPGNALHFRKIEKNGITKIRGKQFAKSEKGYRDAELYSAKVTAAKIAGEYHMCTINKNKKTITIEGPDNFPVTQIKVVGTSSLTKVKGTYNNSGSFSRGFGDVIKSILDTIPGIAGLTIDFDDEATSKLEKRGKANLLTLSAFDYNYINGLFNTEKKATSDNSLYASIRYLNTKIAKLPKPEGKKGKELTETFKNQIVQEVINNLEQADLEKLLFKIYNKYFSTLKQKIELFKKTDTHKLDYVIGEFDNHFNLYHTNEAKWQQLFEDQYRVINPNYKYIIREVDTIFGSMDIEASSRPVDFIGVDIYNNIELVELKTPGTPIVSTKKDRNNYFLTQECTKACTQLEKYLSSLESNKDNIEKLIKTKISEKYGIKTSGINLVLSRPKAKLIIGDVTSLTSKPARHSDFQMQRHSFKNIDIITFDEIYNSLLEIRTELSKKLKRK